MRYDKIYSCIGIFEIKKDVRLLRIFLGVMLCFNFLVCDDFENFEDDFEAPKEIFDPLSGYNRFMTNFNDKAFVHVISPVAKGYRDFVDVSVRDSFSNFFDNLLFPVRFVNNLLQGKFKNSGEELFRFAVNTTLGVGGFGDAGEDIFGIKPHREDFGQTLGFYGVGSGFPIVLPFLGPSNLRDVVGLGGDYFLTPLSYVDNIYLSFGGRGVELINTLSFRVKEIETLRKNAMDLYPFMQDFYENYRNDAIKE